MESNKCPVAVGHRRVDVLAPDREAGFRGADGQTLAGDALVQDPHEVELDVVGAAVGSDVSLAGSKTVETPSGNLMQF